MKGKGFSRRVRDDNLESFRPLLHEPNEGTNGASGSEGKAQSDAGDRAVAEAEELFGGTPLSVRPPYRPPKVSRASKRRGKAATKPKPSTSAPLEGVTAVRVTGPMLWRKKLVASDVQRQPGHPTGGLRMTQARFRDRTGSVIDQTTYFRNLFERFSWRQTRSDPHVEEALVPFEVIIQGKSLGVHDLGVSHKRSGEARQRNYTTILKWGGLGSRIQKLDLIGHILTVYGPAPGESSPHMIVIT